VSVRLGLGRLLRAPSRAKVKARWLAVVALFCLAYIFFAAAFILVRLWLWGSTWLGERAIRAGAALEGTPLVRFLPRRLRTREARRRWEEQLAQNRELLCRCGWLP